MAWYFNVGSTIRRQASPPVLDDLIPYLEAIWSSGTVTNNGPLHQRLELELGDYLKASSAVLFNNGTIALLVALKMMDLPVGSEVITTPLTFAATAHAIAWNGLTPVFADVEPGTLTLCPRAVEKAISSRTSAILGVHVYGTLCDVHGLQSVADRHGLRLVYDAAHAFGATLGGQPVAAFGDASVFSFHATKLFNTFEGGMIATPRAGDRDRANLLRNFGIKNEEEVVDIGINGKMNELQAAIGLLNLRLIEAERAARAELRSRYDRMLTGLPGIRLPPKQLETTNSEQYYHIVVDGHEFGSTRDDIYRRLKEVNIFSRKYFHPICTDFAPYRGATIYSDRNSPYAMEVKSRVLCLPFHSAVTDIHLKTMAAVFHA